MIAEVEPIPKAPEYRETLLDGVDHIESCVGNARQAAHLCRSAFGFDVVASSGPETGMPDRASRGLRQGDVHLVTTAPLSPDDEIADPVRLHGDGVRALAFQVEDAATAFHEAVARGARPAAEPHAVEHQHGAIRLATAKTSGAAAHTSVERGEYEGPFMPGYRAEFRAGSGAGLQVVGRRVCNVELHRTDEWVDWDNRVFGFDVFSEFDQNDIATRYSALRSQVVRGGRGGGLTFPVKEPAKGLKRSQIDEDLERLRQLNILVDRDEHGHLLRIFTRPVEDHPSLGLEVIQREGCRGSGKGDFLALFRATEQEQEARGNL